MSKSKDQLKKNQRPKINGPREEGDDDVEWNALEGALGGEPGEVLGRSLQNHSLRRPSDRGDADDEEHLRRRATITKGCTLSEM